MHLETALNIACVRNGWRLPVLGLAPDQGEENRNFCYRDCAGEPLKALRNRAATATLVMMVLMVL